MPEFIQMSGREELHPQLKQLAQRTLKELELVITKVAANHRDATRFPLPDNPKSLEQRFKRSRFDKLQNPQKDKAAEKAIRLISAPQQERERRLGELSTIRLSDATPIAEQARRLPGLASIRVSDAVRALRDRHVTLRRTPPRDHITVRPQPGTTTPVDSPSEVVADPPPPPPAPNYARLDMRILKIKCIDETNSVFGESGEDEIDLGGTRVVGLGEVEKVEPIGGYDHFEDGVEWVPDGGFKIFTTFNNLTTTIYTIGFVLVEKDNGGLPDLLDDIVDYAKDKVAQEVEKQIREHPPDLPAGTPISNEDLAAAVAEAVKWLIGEAWDLFVEIWEDDPFTPPVTVSLAVPSLTAGFPNGTSNSGVQTANFSGFGGEYEVQYDWQLSV